MTTVVNNPGDSSGGDSSMGLAIGAIFVVLVLVFLFFGLPRLGNNTSAPSAPGQSQGQPSGEGSGDTNVQIPDEIDVDVDTP